MLSEKRPGGTTARTMDEKTAIGRLKRLLRNNQILYDEMSLMERILKPEVKRRNDALVLAIQALEKQEAKKPIHKEKPYSEEVGFNYEVICPTCNSYIGYFTEGMNEPEQMEYCNECGQHIAKDWSEQE